MTKNPALTTTHVLLVEDDDINRLVAEQILESIGIRKISSSSSAEQALELLQKLHPDVILMDIQMAGMDGYQATARIREIYGDKVPIIALTASAVTEERQRCLEAGMNDYVSKPVDPEQLSEVLARWVGKPGSNEKIARTIKNLKARLGADSINEVLESVVNTLPEQKQEIALLIARGQWDKARKLAHRMRGATAIYGGEQIATLLRAVEKSQHDDEADMQRLAAELDIELEKAIWEIKAALGAEEHEPK